MKGTDIIMRILLRALVTTAIVLAISGCKIYQSIGKSVGGFLHPVSGPMFVHIDNSLWDSQNNALIYFYRPHSDWAAEEIESPSVYVDDRHYFNFRNNSYTWLEVKPGVRHIRMRRPLLGLEGLGSFALSKMVDQELHVEAGKVYYLRYSEVTTPSEPNPELPPDSPWNKGDMQLVSAEYAYPEIIQTRFLNSDMLAPNHAATSIVEVNRKDDYTKRKTELEQARKAELARLKAQGQYRSGVWWCLYLCGGDPEPQLEIDAELLALEEEWNNGTLKVAQQEEEGSSWWPF